ncbi:cytochrome P450 family protein [Streptomyces sp. NPDC004393]|uniref:cytochrome P450 family protein n=1 Tax=Streptomyces sp. NPDC004533 TaxID=3154278 RepID=UPI00339EE3D8
MIDLGEYGARFTQSPHEVYAELRERGPVHWVRTPPPDQGEAWLIVGYEEARAVLADPRFSKDATKNGRFNLAEDVMGRQMLVVDPPEHTRLRSLVARSFTMRRVEALRPRVQQLTDELIEEMLPKGRADLVEAFAYPLPITVICELLGVPDIDRGAFRALSNEVVTPSGAEAGFAAMRQLAGFLDELIEDKRCTAPADDLLGDLIRTRAEDGDRLSGSELRAMAFLLLVAGHETTVNLITNAVHTLLTHPEQLAALRADMTLLDGVVEEVLRLEGPVESATFRYASEPLEIAGTAIAEGDPVIVGLGSAGRDGSRFPDPHRFDVHRAPQGHLAFGHGMHFCLGAPLARLEARTALRTLLERCPDLALDGPPGPLLPGMLIRGVRSLPVRW